MAEKTRAQSITSRLTALRDALVAVEPVGPRWTEVRNWAAKAKPFFVNQLPGHVDDLEKLARTPKWVTLPRVGGTPDSEAFNQESREKEDRSNTAIARASHAAIVSFVEGLIDEYASAGGAGPLDATAGSTTEGSQSSKGEHRTAVRAALIGAVATLLAATITVLATCMDGDGSDTKNRPPRAQPDVVTTSGGAPVIAHVLENDTDPEGEALHLVAVHSPSHGTTKALAEGRIEYTPPTGYRGADLFEYIVSDGHTTSKGTVVVTVSGQAPSGPKLSVVVVSVRTGRDDKEDAQFEVRVLQGAREVATGRWGAGETWDDHDHRTFTLYPKDILITGEPIEVRVALQDGQWGQSNHWEASEIKVAIDSTSGARLEFAGGHYFRTGASRRREEISLGVRAFP